MLRVSRTKTYMNHIWTCNFFRDWHQEPRSCCWCLRKETWGRHGTARLSSLMREAICMASVSWTPKRWLINLLHQWTRMDQSSLQSKNLVYLKYEIESDILILKCWGILRYFVGIAAKSSWFILKLSARVAVCFSSAPFANVEQDFVAHPGTTNWPLSGLWFFPFLWDATKIENLTFLILRVKVFGRRWNETAPCLSEVSLEQIVNVYNT